MKNANRFCQFRFNNMTDDGSDNKTRKVIETVLSSEDAQLVVLNGDLISGEAVQDANSSSKYVDRIVAPIIDNDLPWASTYGNHDSELNLDPEDIFSRETTFSNSLTQKRVSGSTAGITNYYLPVFSHDASDDTTPVFILWFFDSQGGHYHIDKNYNGTSVPRQNWVDASVSWQAVQDETAYFASQFHAFQFWIHRLTTLGSAMVQKCQSKSHIHIRRPNPIYSLCPHPSLSNARVPKRWC
jgi:hypothetical protein